MDEHGREGASSAFQFHGTWQEFAPIAFTNLLLTIVTLGFYRFWGTTRVRQYLWSQSQFIDERLEWTGTGKELFVGFLMAVVLLFLPLVGIQFLIQALTLRGYTTLAGLTLILFYFVLLYIIGLARFRALRYRLGRTYWHGIRGGSDDQGFAYGWSYVWKSVLGIILFGLFIPWSMIELWNDRWNSMSFGSHRIEASANLDGLIGRWIGAYAVIVFMFIALGVMMVALATMIGSTAADGSSPADAIVAGVILGVLVFYLFIGLAFLAFYAKFYRNAVEGLSLHKLEFAFSARTMDWFKLILGDIGLVLVTLGIGSIFLSYRHWKFFIVHMQAYGEVDLTELTQSTTLRSRHGEGLLDAFDVGAI